MCTDTERKKEEFREHMRKTCFLILILSFLYATFSSIIDPEKIDMPIMRNGERQPTTFPYGMYRFTHFSLRERLYGYSIYWDDCHT